jgi:hypothetical protein
MLIPKVAFKLADNFKELLRFTQVPNAILLFNKFKEELDNKVKYIGNNIKLLTITEKEFITHINQLYEKRKLVSIDETQIE